jgi:hypothetical protein
MSDAAQALVGMGFPEEQVRAALLAAFDNVERATQYLLDGIPAGAPAAAPPPPVAPPAAGSGVAAPLEGLPVPIGPVSLSSIRGIPALQFLPRCAALVQVRASVAHALATV